jgi:hypothetical protein
MRAFLIMSSRPRLLAGSAKEWLLELTEPGRECSAYKQTTSSLALQPTEYAQYSRSSKGDQ